MKSTAFASFETTKLVKLIEPISKTFIKIYYFPNFIATSLPLQRWRAVQEIGYAEPEFQKNWQYSRNALIWNVLLLKK